MLWCLFLLFFSSLVSCNAAAPPSPVRGTLLRLADRTWTALAATAESDLEFEFPDGLVFLLGGADGEYVLPGNASHAPIEGGFGRAWWLPSASNASEPAWEVIADGPMSARFSNGSWRIRIQAADVSFTRHRSRPRADAHGDAFSLDIADGDALMDALAGFYWGTMLPCVVERTTAADYPVSEGYVVSTLADKYQGTYPDVDHEFQIKGRMALGSSLDLAVVRRMIELQLRLAREDPCQLWRAPCSLQPDGAREYHIRRSSEDAKTNANMFLVTGNIELVENVWLYVTRSKDYRWLRAHIKDVESVLGQVESHIDSLGRLWSDVYYEDQVMKDGRETLSSALASHSFDLLAQLETQLGRNDTARRYELVAQLLRNALAEPMPVGYWDAAHGRFVDWVDRSGLAHDHIHLLANILPVMFGAATPNQSQSVMELVERELDEFQRFPTFLAARIANYTHSEIGDGGPYDLCAAGRYWYWDAAFWSWRRQGDMLLDQLNKVASMGASEDYIMGERYDMDYVYYVDGSPWHGAAHYYEYPCVYAWVLIAEYLGVRPALAADVRVAPMLIDAGTVTLNQSAYRLRYEHRQSHFALQNLGNDARSFEFDLSALYPGAKLTIRLDKAHDEMPFDGLPVVLEPGASVILRPNWSGSEELR